jgi:type IV fimbrial biogenesis protein FimT
MGWRHNHRMLLYPPMPPAPRHRGFTLIELMVTVAIVAILAALAAPSLQAFIVRNTFASIGNEFQGSLLRARTEATGKNTCTTMCMSSTVDSTSPTCTSSGSDWQIGWIVFLNPDCNTALNAPVATEDMVLVRRAGNSNYYLQSQRSTPTRKINFDARGNIGLNRTDEFDLIYQGSSNPNTMNYGFNICLAITGRTRSIPASNNCSNF